MTSIRPKSILAMLFGRFKGKKGSTLASSVECLQG